MIHMSLLLKGGKVCFVTLLGKGLQTWVDSIIRKVLIRGCITDEYMIC